MLCWCASKQKIQKITNVRTVKIDDIIISYNEGFADLISYYGLDPQERAFKGVKCLEVSRDVGSALFYNGKKKDFNEEALQSYFSNFLDIPFSSCDEHSYQDSHILGAIFAHSADVFLSELTNSDNEKMAALVDWVKLLKSEKTKNPLATPESFLESTFTLFLTNSLKRFDRQFDQDTCLVVNKIYPGLDIQNCSVKKEL